MPPRAWSPTYFPRRLVVSQYDTPPTPLCTRKCAHMHAWCTHAHAHRSPPRTPRSLQSDFVEPCNAASARLSLRPIPPRGTDWIGADECVVFYSACPITDPNCIRELQPPAQMQRCEWNRTEPVALLGRHTETLRTGNIGFSSYPLPCSASLLANSLAPNHQSTPLCAGNW